MKHGKGKVTFADPKDYFEGEFENDLKHGFGVLKLPTFSFEGNWKDDIKEGHGCCVWKNGNTYTGNY